MTEPASFAFTRLADLELRLAMMISDSELIQLELDREEFLRGWEKLASEMLQMCSAPELSVPPGYMESVCAAALLLRSVPPIDPQNGIRNTGAARKVAVHLKEAREVLGLALSQRELIPEAVTWPGEIVLVADIDAAHPELAIEMMAALDELHRALGGGGLEIRTTGISVADVAVVGV